MKSHDIIQIILYVIPYYVSSYTEYTNIKLLCKSLSNIDITKYIRKINLNGNFGIFIKTKKKVIYQILNYYHH